MNFQEEQAYVFTCDDNALEGGLYGDESASVTESVHTLEMHGDAFEQASDARLIKGPRVRARMRTGQRCLLHCAPGYERNLRYPAKQDPASGEWERINNYTRVPTMQAHCAADGVGLLEATAGEPAAITITPRDAFGNAVAPKAVPEPDDAPPPSPTRGLATFLVFPGRG